MAEGPVAPLSGRLGGLRPVLGEMGRISISIESPSSLTFPRLDGLDGLDRSDGWCSFSCTSCGKRWKENTQGTNASGILS